MGFFLLPTGTAPPFAGSAPEMLGCDNHEEMLKNARIALASGDESVFIVLAEQAARCRRLASATHDREAAGILSAMAADYEQTESTLRADNDR